MENQRIELPDLLLNNYNSWFELYMHLKQLLEGQDYNDSTPIFLGEHGQGKARGIFIADTLPLSEIKAKALDEVIEKLPNLKEAGRVKQFVRIQGTSVRNDDILSVSDNLFDLAKIMDKYKGQR